jgi:2-oxoglutarate ferredoxin oxidoreductase subunit alpha
MPTRTQQADLLSTAYLSHGDTKHVLLFPANPEESFTMARDAFDLAERFQTPVFVMMDLDIGMNDWMCRRFHWDDSYRPDRGKVLDAAALQKVEKFFRYLSPNGDGVAARTLPGVDPKGSYFTRGSGHNKLGGYTEDSDEYREVVDRLTRKLAAAGEAVPAPEIIEQEGATAAVITLGGCRGAVLEGLDRLREQGVILDYMRVRGFPFGAPVREFLARHDKHVVIEQNRDGQLRSLLILETGLPPERFLSVREYGGLPLGTNQVVQGVLGVLQGAEVPV